MSHGKMFYAQVTHKCSESKPLLLLKSMQWFLNEDGLRFLVLSFSGKLFHRKEILLKKVPLKHSVLILTKDLPGRNRSRRMNINAQLKIRM